MIENLYDEILNTIPRIGDFVISEYYTVGNIIGFSTENYEDEDEASYYSFTNIKVYYHYYSPRNKMGQYYCDPDSYQTSLRTISPKLANILINIDNRVIDILISSIRDKYDNMYTKFDRERVLFNCIEDYMNGIITPFTHQMILGSGVKKIINRDKKTGIRTIMFKNEQIWRVHRTHYSKSNRRLNIRKCNKKRDTKMKSVSYQLIERIK